MNSAKALDVVVVNYNAGDALKQCLSMFTSAGEEVFQTVVVDNNSTDDSLADIEKSNAFSQLTVVRNPTNVGFAKACNQGAELGEADCLAFVNPDCFVSSQQLQELSNTLLNHKAAALIGCRVMNEDGSIQAATRRRLPTFWRIFFHMTKLSKVPGLRGININDDGLFAEVQNVEAVNGACVVIKRQHFEQLGGYDEGFPLHFEDLDLFARIKAQDLDVLYAPNIEVKHLKGQSSVDTKQVTAWKRRGLLRYLLKHRPHWEYQIARFILGSK